MPTAAEQDAVHAELTQLLGDNGPLIDAPTAVSRRIAERDFREAVYADYLDTHAPGKIDHRAAIVTAGPPGAGKSHALRQIPNHADFRDLDADDVKDRMLKLLDLEGLLDEPQQRILADGRRLMPGELATWVHRGSTALTDEIRDECLATGENVLIQGTLSWPDLPAILVGRLDEFGYTDLTVLDVEVDCATARAQARDRWWAGRISGGPLGGRFVPDSAIIEKYAPGAVLSTCAKNACALVAAADDLGIAARRELVCQLGPDQPRTTVIVDARGTIQHPRPGLVDFVACARCGQPLTAAESVRHGYGPRCRSE